MITSNDKEYLERMAQTHQCPEHGKKLVAAWHAGENSYVIRCGEGHFPEEVVREPSRTEEFMTGQLQKVDPLFNLLPKADLATGELLTPDAIQFLIAYAEKYGMDAYRGHVTLMYGKPYIGIDGYLYYGHRQRKPFTVSCWPLKLHERPEYQVEDGDHAWIAEVRFTESGATYQGIGIVTREEMAEMSKKDTKKLRSPIVAAHPWQMATKRAEWQALRRAFPIGETEEEKEE